MTKKNNSQEDGPKGTMVILIAFLAITILSWFGVYMLLINRGG